MKPRPDLVDARSPQGLEVFQLTDDPAGATHVYMEAQIFTPDSRRLVLHRSCHPHGSDHHDPQHQYLLCDLDNHGALSPLTDELGPTAPSISPDGQYFYYLVNRTELNDGSIELKRVRLDGTGRESLQVIDSPLPGMKAKVSRIYPLSTISSDGRRFAAAGFFGDGQSPGVFGLMVFQLDKGRCEVIIAGQTWCNLHPQFSRSLDPEQSHDILIQENHGNEADLAGTITKLVGGVGCDIHVIRDDGTNLRDLPWGRDGIEHCQGHQCWRGRSDLAITTATIADGSNRELLFDGYARKHQGHVGKTPPGGRRAELSGNFEGTRRFFHFATDIAGQWLVTDYNPQPERGCELYLGQLGQPLSPVNRWTRLLDTRTDFKKCHAHPFLSPDARTVFFNSDESGKFQAYMARGF